MDEQNPFSRPGKPKISLELLKWAIFEPIRLKQFNNTISKKEKFFWFLETSFWIIFLSLVCYLISLDIVVSFDLPSKYPELFERDIKRLWDYQTPLYS